MLGKIKQKLSKSLYTKVYGNKAEVLFKEDTVEVLIGSRKIIHDMETGKKLTETIFSTDNMIVIKYDENEKKISEDIYVDNKKVSGSAVDGRSGSISDMAVENGVNKAVKKYNENGESFTETVYTYDDRNGETVEIIQVEGDEYISTNLLRKDSEGNVLFDVQRKDNKSGCITFYREKGLTLELEYFEENKVKVFDLSKEVEVPEESQGRGAKGKGKGKSKSSADDKNKVNTKLEIEILKFNENGKIVYVERNDETIVKEYYENGKPYRQYIVLQTQNGKELIGQLITEDEDIKIINNSMLDNEDIVLRNDDVFNIDRNYKEYRLEAYNFEIENGELIIFKEIFKIAREFNKIGRVFDLIVNGAPYVVEEEYVRGKLYSHQKTNKISGTKLISEANKKYVVGMDGRKKEVTEGEYEVYRIVDELNKAEIEVNTVDKKDT